MIWLGDYPSLKSSGPTAWHLNPNTLGGLIWDFKSVQVSNWVVQQLGIWIQTRWGVIWLGDYPSFKSSGPTVWNPESKHVEGWFDLGTTQVSNRLVQQLSIWIQTRWGMIWLGDYPSLKSSGPTAWHSNPNTLRGDLTWGLPKSQIEWTNGLEPLIQTRWGVIWLGDYPSLKSSEPTVWNP